MTVIVGIESDGKVYMGGDSGSATIAMTNATSLSKVFRLGNMLIGYTTSFRMGQVLEHNVILPVHKKDDSDIKYLVSWFIPCIRECFANAGYLGKEMDESRDIGGQFLLGYRGKLYTVYSDFQVNRGTEGYGAVGSGVYFATGAMMTAISMGETRPKSILKYGMKAAAYYNPFVRKPFVIKSI